MNIGLPPTDLNALTGELTPPGINFFASLKLCSLRLFFTNTNLQSDNQDLSNFY